MYPALYPSGKLLKIGLLLIVFLSALQCLTAQQLRLKDFAIWGGSAPAGVFNGNQGLFISKLVTITGSIGSNHIIKSSREINVTGNLFSGNRVLISRTNSLSGNITANNQAASTVDTIFRADKATLITGNVTVKGKVFIDKGSNVDTSSVKGTVYVPAPTNTYYSGPVPRQGYSNTVVLPVSPSMPNNTPFDSKVGTVNISTTQTINPGSYGNLTLTAGRVLTFNGPGNYIFNSVNNGANEIQLNFDFKSTTAGVINLYIVKDANWGKVTVKMINGNYPDRIYTEVHGNGASNGGNAFEINGSAINTANYLTWAGAVWTPNAGINVGKVNGVGTTDSVNISGALWSATRVNVSTNLRLKNVATQVEPNFIAPYYPPPINGKVDQPNNKIGSELFSLATNAPLVSIIPDNTTFRILGDKVFIEVIGVNANDLSLKAQLAAAGMIGFVNNGPYSKIISGYFPINQLTTLNSYTSIRYVRPLYPPLNNAGQTTTQGDTAMRADKVRTRFGADGDGVKIGILSDSYNNKGGAAADVTEGDLPNDVQVVQDFAGNDEGRAMMQIAYDIAPKAKLAFRTGFQTAGDFAQGISELSSTLLPGGKCDVIVDDITYVTEPFLRDGKVAEAVNNAVTNGVTYFSSAGNFGARSYESVYQNAGTNPAIIPAPATLHRFGATNADTYQTLKLKPGSYTIVLQWSDEFFSQGLTSTSPSVQTDLDLYLVGTSGFTLFGFNRSNLTGDPFEVCPFTVTDTTEARLIVVKASTNTVTNLRFKYIIFRGDGTIFNYPNDNASTIVGHPNADSCIAVGAMLYGVLPGVNDGPGQFPGVASFSSRGGSATLAPGSTTTYVQRKKPNLVAPNGVNTTVTLGAQPAGFNDGDSYPNFFGTSAAAPHAAAVASLLIQARKKYDLQTIVSPYDIRTLLQSSAGKFSTLGDAFNFTGGNGFVRADSAIKRIANARPIISSLGPDLKEKQIKPNGTNPFAVKVKGAYLANNTKIYFKGLPITTTISADQTEATGIIPSFVLSEDPPVQLFNPAKTISGLDGGLSEPLYFFSTIKQVRVKALDASRNYGQANPAFAVKIWIDNVPIENTNITPATLKLDGTQVSYATNANPLSIVGLYGIIPSRTTPLDPVADAAIIKAYTFTFQSGTLNVGKMPLKITPKSKTIKYGDYIGEVTYNYEFPTALPGTEALLNQVKDLHKKYIADNALGVIQGFNQQETYSTTDLANMSAMASFQAVSNARKFGIGNGQLQPLVNIANSAFADQRFLIDVAVQSFANYKTNPAQSPMVSSLGEGSGQRAVLNLKSLANGVAKSSIPTFGNGQLQPIVNGQLMAMVNGQLQAVVNGQLQALVNGETSIEGVAQDYVFENGQLQALVNGSWIKITSGQLQAIVNGAEFLVNISVTNGQLQAIVNGQLMAIVNGQLQAIVNGQLLAMVNGQLQALVNGQLMPIVNGQLLAMVNGQLQPMVNGQLLALVNGQLMALVNGQLMAIVNGQLESISNLTQLSNGQLQALVNGQLQAIVNGQLKALVNGIITDIPTTSVSLSNGQLQAIVNGQLQAMVNGQLQPLVNGQLLPIVNQLQSVEGVQLINGQLRAIVNGQLLPIVNGQLQAMVNGIVITIPNTSINIVNGQLQAIVNGQLQALVNGQLQPLVNGQLQAVVNGQAYPVSNLTRLSNGQLQAIVNGQLQPIVNGQLQAVVNGIATPIANESISFANGQLQAIVNGQLQALVNGQLLAIVNGQLQPIVNGDLQPVSVARLSNGQLRAVVNGNNIPIANGQLQAIVNTGSGLTNGQLLAMVNGQLMAMVNGELTFTVFRNGQLQALVNGQLQPIVNGQLQPIVNGQLQPLVNVTVQAVISNQLIPVDGYTIVNGQLQAIVNGQLLALVNGQLLALVNGQLLPIVNNFNISGTTNNTNTVAIVDDHDITLQGGALGGMFAINMITGLSAGTQKLIPAAFVNENFDVTYGLGNVTITKRPVVITAENKTKVYGDLNPTLTMTGAGFAYGEALNNITLPSISTTATTISPIGIYPITLSGGSASNYDLVLVNGTFKVDRRDLTITIGNATKVYGDQNPPFTYIPTGFVNSETQSVITTQPIIGSDATTTSAVGNYDITGSGGVATNYNLVFVNGTLTVTGVAPVFTCPDNIPLILNGSGDAVKISAIIVNREVVISSSPQAKLLPAQNDVTKTLSGSCDCPPGHAVVGYTGRVGEIVDKFRLICAPINSDGSPGASATTSCSNGPLDGGNPVAPIIALNRSWMVGFGIGDQTAYYNRSGTLSSIVGYSQIYTDVINGSTNRIPNTEMRGTFAYQRTSVEFAPPGYVITGMNYHVDDVIPGPYSSTVQFKYQPLVAAQELARIAVTDNSSGNLNVEIRGNTTFTNANIGTNPITLIVTNSSGISSTCTTNITVKGAAITFNCPPTSIGAVNCVANITLDGIQNVVTGRPNSNDGNVQSDGQYQSFTTGNQATFLREINVSMRRYTQYANTSMQATIYLGIGTGGTVLGTLNIASYNGGVIDFSTINNGAPLQLSPNTSYTLRMLGNFNFANNYFWDYSNAIAGDPAGSLPNGTLKMAVKLESCQTNIAVATPYITGVGPDGKAISFNGNNYAQDATSRIPQTGPFTLSFWAKQTANQDNFVEMMSQGRNLYIGHEPNIGFNGNRIGTVTAANRSGRSLLDITYNIRQSADIVVSHTTSAPEFIRSKLVLSTLTANPLTGGDANRFWSTGKTSITKDEALSVTGDLDLGTVFQDCADPVGVNHTVLFDKKIYPGEGPEIFIVHGGLSGNFEILDENGNVALTIPYNAGSPVTVGGTPFTTTWSPAFYLRDNVNFSVEALNDHINTQNGIIAIDIHPGEMKRISGIRFGGGGCNYTYEILGVQPDVMPYEMRIGDFNNTNVAFPKDANWHNYALVRDVAGNNTHLYLDGELVHSKGSLSPSPTGSNNGLVFGATWDLSEKFIGNLDEVKIYNYAMSASEVLCNQTRSTTGTETGLVGYYNFEEGSGISINNLASGGGNSTLISPSGNDWVRSIPVNGIFNGAPLNSATYYSINTLPDNKILWIAPGYNLDQPFCKTNITAQAPAYCVLLGRSSQPATTKTKVKPTQEAQQAAILKESIYPNPATNTIKLQLGKEVTSANGITLVDAIGRLQSNISIRQLNKKLFELNISNLPKGVYIIKAKTLEGDKTFKFVKM